MPLLHCLGCHHEWEGKEHSICNWCGKGSYVLAQQTSLGKMLESPIVEKMMQKLQAPIAFSKTKAPYGWLSNMSPSIIVYEDVEWRTAEALFQALRFNDHGIREEIRSEKSPMAAKFVAKRNAAKMVVEPCSQQDVDNMLMVLSLKLEQHDALQNELAKTHPATIIEDCSNRKGGNNLFWGAALIDGEWHGENKLGKLWMSLRDQQ